MPDAKPKSAGIRVMMIGPFPTFRDRLDGGVSAATTYLAESLAAAPGIDLVGVRISKGDGGAGGSTAFDWPVVDLPLGRLSLSTLYRRQKRRLGEIVERFRPDVVHGQGTDVAGFLAVASGLPSVITVHGLLAECARYQTEFRMKARALLVAALTERHTIRRATDLIAISPYVKRYYQDDIRGRIHDIPNAVGPRFFGIERNPERGRILYAGRIAHGKGLPELIQAVAKSREAIEKLVLAGAAPDRSYEAMLRAKAARLGVAGKVVFAGLLDETSLLREFALAEALVLPSHQETAPMVVQQAMASGLPVVATTVGGIPDQIENEATGLLFEAGNVERLAGHLGRLTNDPKFARTLGIAGRRKAEVLYTASAVARATVTVYETARRHGSEEAASCSR